MAAKLTLDIEQGHSASHDVLSGWDYTRVALVEGLDPALTTADLLAAALTVVINGDGTTAGVGDRGSTYYMPYQGPLIITLGNPPQGPPVYLKQFIPEAIVGSSGASTGAVKVRIVYRGYPCLIYDFDGALAQIESNIDVYGKRIILSYTPSANYPFTDLVPGVRYPKSPLVPRRLFQPVFTVKFLIVAVPGGMTFPNVRGYTLVIPPMGPNDSSNATSIMTAFGAMSGTTNDGPYTIGGPAGSQIWNPGSGSSGNKTITWNGISGNKHTWMMHFAAHSSDGGASYEATMKLEYRPTGWDVTETFTCPGTGEPPSDLIISKIKPTDWPNTPPEYADPDGGKKDIGQTVCATADESRFPSFGFANSDIPAVNN